MNDTAKAFSDPAQRAAAEWACVKLVYEFGRLVDARRYEDLVALFAEDAEFNRPSEPERIVKGRAALLADFQTRPRYVSAHLFTNVQATASDTASATGSCYLIMYTGQPDRMSAVGAPLANAQARIGAFEDEFVCRDGVWLIRRRVGRMMLVIDPAG